MIPANKMIALFDTEDMKVTKLIVINIDDQNRLTDKLPASAGACDDGWLKNSNPLDTPFGLYTYLATGYGFATREAMFAALHEFRKVEGQAIWVEELLARAGDPKFRGEIEARG